MTKYIKTGTTEFEQFDLSKKMSEKYDIEHYRNGYDAGGTYTYGHRIQTLEGAMEVHLGDWIATGVEGEHWPVKDEIFKRTYKKLPTIPKFVADDLENSKRAEYSITMFLDDCFGMINDIVTNKTWNWCDTYMERHPDSNDYHVVLARAWLDGYEVQDDTKNDNCI